MNKMHNLDESIQEYFEFTIFGKKYKFKHLTTEEMMSMKDVEKEEDPKALEKFLLSFIEKVDEDAPDFEDVQKKMIVPHWIKFRNMIKDEFGG